DDGQQGGRRAGGFCRGARRPLRRRPAHVGLRLLADPSCAVPGAGRVRPARDREALRRAASELRWRDRAALLARARTVTVRVLTHVGGEVVETIAREVPDVEVIAIPGDGELEPHVQGDVLFTMVWGTSNMPQALERGVRWVHTMGTGV